MAKRIGEFKLKEHDIWMILGCFVENYFTEWSKTVSVTVCIDLFHIYGVQQIIENNMWEYQTRRRGLGAVVCGLC